MPRRMTTVHPDELAAAAIGELRACAPCRGRASAARCEARTPPAGRARAPGRRTTRPGGRRPRCDGRSGSFGRARSARSGQAPAAAQPSRSSTPVTPRASSGTAATNQCRSSWPHRNLLFSRRHARAGAGAGRCGSTSTTSSSTRRPVPAKRTSKNSPRASEPTSMRGAADGRADDVEPSADRGEAPLENLGAHGFPF